MKSFYRIGAYILFFFGLIGFSSCLDSNDNDYPEDSIFMDLLQGHWSIQAESASVPNNLQVVFTQNEADFVYLESDQPIEGLQADLVMFGNSSYLGGAYRWFDVVVWPYQKDVNKEDPQFARRHSFYVQSYSKEQIILREQNNPNYPQVDYIGDVILKKVKDIEIENIEGAWLKEGENENIQYTFNNDKTGYKTIKSNSENPIKEPFKYKFFKENRVLQLYLLDPDNLEKETDRQAFIILSTTNGVMKIQTAQGQIDLKRVPLTK